jgi:dipeptidyl aminopeptidase/acylaminoacyl peptidase
MDEATFQTMAGMRVVYSLPGMEKVPVRRDILFKTVGDLRLKMDLYTPGDLIPGSTRPAVIFVSGGDASADTLRTREIGLYISYGQLLAASGFVGIVFDHRGLEGYTQLREVGEDTDDLVAYVCTHAASLGVNPQKLGIWAFSAGPIYGLRTAFRTAPPSIRCAIAYYGGMSLLNKRYFHYTEEEEPLFREFSPVCYLHETPARIPPLFVARAALDRPFLNESIDEFMQVAVTKNVPITLVNHPEGMHGFDMRNDDERSREIIHMTLEFIKVHLGKPERE